MYRLKQWYVNFLEKKQRSFLEKIFYLLLIFLSLIYAMMVNLRNFFYDKKLIGSYRPQRKTISIGNISWAGTGKTSLSILLYQKLSPWFKVAILRRGYGDDEKKLLKDITPDVFSAPDRYRLAKELEASFDLFILDDGFQFRKLRPDINIVISGAREFRKKIRLIPAGIFRESKKALRRADLVMINYADEIKDLLRAKTSLIDIGSQFSVYFAKYRVKEFVDLSGEVLTKEFLKTQKIAALSAIGYPQGFLNKLKESGLEIRRSIVYPDHYQLSRKEFNALQNELLQQEINYLIITHKDKYHLPPQESKINIVIMKVELIIENENLFLNDILKKLGKEK